MQSIWAREEFPLLKYGLIASDSAVTGQTDKARFANVAFSYFDLGKKKKITRSLLLQGVAPPTDLFYYY